MSTSHPLLKSKLILAFLVLILLSIAHLYHDFYKLQMMNKNGAGGGLPLSESFPAKEPQYLNSSDFSTSITSSALTKSFSEIVNQTKQVVIATPAKAAGTSMIRFARKCSPVQLPINVINFKGLLEKSTFTNNYDVPSVIAAHVYTDKPFDHLVKGSTRETLIIYSHRDELSRVRSAIQMVLMSHICNNDSTGRQIKKKYKFTVEVNKNRCTIDEKQLIRIIKGKEREIGIGAPEILTCKFFDSIAQNDPSNLVIVDYKQANKLQTILAKKHCPHILKDLPIATNVAADKEMQPFVRLKTDPSRVVTLTEWLDKKQGVILWALDLKKEMDCQSKITDMEDHLNSCPDESVTLIHGKYQCVSLSA